MTADRHQHTSPPYPARSRRCTTAHLNPQARADVQLDLGQHVESRQGRLRTMTLATLAPPLRRFGPRLRRRGMVVRVPSSNARLVGHLTLHEGSQSELPHRARGIGHTTRTSGDGGDAVSHQRCSSRAAAPNKLRSFPDVDTALGFEVSPAPMPSASALNWYK